MISENNEKQNINHKNNNNNKANNSKFKNNFYSMSEGNSSISEPKLEVLPFA